MKTAGLLAVILIPLAFAGPASKSPALADVSGNIGIFAIVDRVQFEPNEQQPERIRVHGAFSFVNLQDFGAGRATRSGSVASPLGMTWAVRGFLYFRLPAPSTPQVNLAATRREWADLKSVAGTGQAVAFGEFFYLGQFENFRADGRGSTAPQTLVNTPNTVGEFRVYSATDTAATPVVYMTNVGVVRLTEASHAAVIKQLREVPR